MEPEICNDLIAYDVELKWLGLIKKENISNHCNYKSAFIE